MPRQRDACFLLPKLNRAAASPWCGQPAPELLIKPAVRPQTKCCASAQSTRALLATARLPQRQRPLGLNKQQVNAGDSAAGSTAV